MNSRKMLCYSFIGTGDLVPDTEASKQTSAVVLQGRGRRLLECRLYS